MNASFRCRAVGIIAGCLFAAVWPMFSGCGGPAGKPSGKSGANPRGGEKSAAKDDRSSGEAGASDSADDDSGVKRYSVTELKVKPGDPMPPLDGGRLEIAAPVGWDWKRPSSGEHIVGFHVKGGTLNSMPRILVSVDAAATAGLDDLDEATVQEFAAAVTQQLQGAKLKAPVQAMLIGDVPCARYVESARKGNAWVARQFIKTVAGGRTYTVLLESYEDQFGTYRDAGYAVVASMKFAAAGSPPTIPETPQPEAPATEAPAETAPPPGNS